MNHNRFVSKNTEQIRLKKTFKLSISILKKYERLLEVNKDDEKIKKK